MEIETTYIFNLNDIENRYEKFLEFNCYFVFENIEVFTQNNQLIFIIQSETDEHSTIASTIEIAAKNRPKVIALLDVISFLTGNIITIYTNQNTGSGWKDKTKCNQALENKIHFSLENNDFTDCLIKIIESLTEEKFLIASLLDKWNKANYLLTSDDSSVLFMDEAILNYLHIFELISDTIKKDYDKKIETELYDLLQNFFNRTGFDTEKSIDSKIQEKKKITKEILIGDFLPFKDKLKFFLKSNKLLDNDVSFFIDNSIKLRNDIAHGRMINNMDIMSYPLTPFYNTSSKKNELVEPLSILTAVCISKYIEISLWEDKWVEVKKILQPNNEIMKEYIDDKLPEVDINSENISKINWYSLFRFYISCNNKTKKKVEQKVKCELKNIPFENLNIASMIELVIVLSGTEDEELLSVIKKIINNAKEQDYYFHDAYRDLLYYLESQNYNTKKIKQSVKKILL